MFQLDHVIIAVTDLDAAVRDYQVLGFTVIYGGTHASGATHNALICFHDGTYLELLAPTGQAPQPGTTDFSPLLAQGEGLVGYALRTTNLEVEAELMHARGIHVDATNEGRRLRPDGIELRWRTVTIDGGMSPFLIEDVTPRNLRVPDDAATTHHANGVTGIRTVEGADFTALKGNQRLTGLRLIAPYPLSHGDDRELTHQVSLAADGAL
jgi:catechol 2,3-dioxygenase-like lactoylglutathione lyase family enzyme